MDWTRIYGSGAPRPRLRDALHLRAPLSEDVVERCAGGRGRALLSGAGGLDRQVVAGHAAGRGVGGDDLRRPGEWLGGPCGVEGLCPARALVPPAGGATTSGPMKLASVLEPTRAMPMAG